MLQNSFPNTVSDVPAPYEPQIVCIDEYLIDGRMEKWIENVQQVSSPICIGGNPTLLGHYPLMGEQQSIAALDAAKRAYNNGRGDWPSMHVAERIKCVLNFMEMMKTKREIIANLIMWEVCKSYEDSLKEFDRTVEYIQDTVKALKDLDHQCSRFVEDQGIMAQIRRAPLGVTLVMGPFNYALNETLCTMIPALLMGNTVVMKPPKMGVILFKHLLEPFRQAFPAGVVNTIFGDGKVIVSPIVKSPDLDVLAFIGSSKVAHMLKSQHPRLNRLRCVLGLDAKNPGIVTPSADIDLTVKECLAGALTFNGQRCTALKILFVHESVAVEFSRKLADAMDQMHCGMPWEQKVHITPLAEPNKVEYLTGLIDDANLKGARVINQKGGENDHTLFWPALVYDVNSTMRLYHEEQFGPVVPICVYGDPAVPLQYMTDSPFGQQVSIFSSDPGTVGEYVDYLINQQCRININSQCQRGPDSFPFTGRKNSAEGTLSITDALKVFSIRSVVAFKGTDATKLLVQRVLRGNHSDSLSTNYLM